MQLNPLVLKFCISKYACSISVPAIQMQLQQLDRFGAFILKMV